MHITELTWRHKNDFQFIAFCRHCQKESWHGDGYADALYQQQVFPARHCEHCGLNEYGEIREAAPTSPGCTTNRPRSTTRRTGGTKAVDTAVPRA